MYLTVVLLLTPWMVCGQSVNFTINRIELKALPLPTIKNGDNLHLKCLVDIAKITDFELANTFTFYKDDILIHNVTTTNSQAIYTIQNASVSRSGLYKCQVVADKRQKKSEEITVKVTGLWAPLISVTKMEVSEGDEIIVRCEAPNEEPPMIFNFYKTDKEKGPAKQKMSTKNYAEVKYEIKEGESILHFECTLMLMIAEPESPLSRRQTVTVVESFSIPAIRVRPSNNFTEGAVMEVTCTVQKSHRRSEEVTITLQKDNQILKSSKLESLTYSQMATVNDMGNYTCKAEGTTASKTTSAMVKVKELFPKPRLTLSSTSNKTEYINDGDRVALECSVSGLSPQESSKEVFYLIVNNGEKKYRKSGGMFLMNLMATDSGDYKCEVTIANITKTSEQVKVKVYAAVTKPELKQIFKGNKMVVLGDTLILTCRSPTGTPPITYTLYREEELLERKEMENNSEAIFMVNTTKLHDLGRYQCHASNRNHKSNALSEVLNVTVIAPVVNVSLVIIPENGEVEEGAELSLVCNVEYGTLPLTFNFYVKKGKDNVLINVTKTDDMHAEFMVSSFTKEKEGSYFCNASNKANKYAESKAMEVKAVLARWKKVIIGIFVVFLIVAAIAITLYLYLDKKRKGKNFLTDSSRSKATNSSSEKSAADVKTDDSYFGSVQNEEELHILKKNSEEEGLKYSDSGSENVECKRDSIKPDKKLSEECIPLKESHRKCPEEGSSRSSEAVCNNKGLFSSSGPNMNGVQILTEDVDKKSNEEERNEFSYEVSPKHDHKVPSAVGKENEGKVERQVSGNQHENFQQDNTHKEIVNTPVGTPRKRKRQNGKGTSDGGPPQSDVNSGLPKEEGEEDRVDGVNDEVKKLKLSEQPDSERNQKMADNLPGNTAGRDPQRPDDGCGVNQEGGECSQTENEEAKEEPPKPHEQSSSEDNEKDKPSAMSPSEDPK